MTTNPAGGEPRLTVAGLGGIDLRAMPSVLGRLARLALRYPWRCSAAAASALGAAVANLAMPRLLGEATDRAHGLLALGSAHADEARAALMLTAGLLVAACALRGIFAGLQGYLGENVAQRVGYDLRLAYFEKLQRLSFGFHDGVHSGDLIARGMLDLEGVRAYLESGLLRLITLALLLGVGSWRLFHAHAALAAAALSFVPFVLWRAMRMGVLLRLSWRRLQQMMSDLTLGMEENLQGVRVVRAFAAQALELAKFDRVADAALLLSNQRITMRMASISQMNTAYYLAMGLVLLLGGRWVAEGSLSVGSLTEFLTFMTILQQPLRQVSMIVNSGARASSAGARLFEVLDAEPQIRDAPLARDLVVTDGILRFEAVDFSYDGRANALTDISFTVGPGKTLGVVGPPGSGKSTIAQLIPRFYDASAGRITIDGQDVRAVTLESLRRQVGLVQQEIFLFDTSVHENVAYAEPWVEEERVVEASTVAQIHEHVASLPDGYDTRVGERGVAFSGGQRQRMSIARGLVAEPRIMVLDDATAAIDAATEQRVRAALRGAVQSMSTIIIAHRLSALRHADEIIVLEAGRIVERGTHEELRALCGRYASVWDLQNHAEPEAPATRIVKAQT